MRILLIALGHRGYAPLQARSLSSLGHEVTLYTGLKAHDLVTRLRRVVLVRVPSLLGRDRHYLWSEQTRLRSYLRRKTESFDLVLFLNAHSLATDELLAELRDRGQRTGLWMLDETDTVLTDGL